MKSRLLRLQFNKAPSRYIGYIGTYVDRTKRVMNDVSCQNSKRYLIAPYSALGGCEKSNPIPKISKPSSVSLSNIGRVSTVTRQLSIIRSS